MKGCSTRGWFTGNSHMNYWDHSPFTHGVFTLSASDSSTVMQIHIWNWKIWFDMRECVDSVQSAYTLTACLSLSGSSLKCNHICALTQCLNPGAESCFLDWAVALPGKLLSSPKWKLWLDQRTHTCWSELAGGSWRALCCFSWSGLVWLGSVWSVPACYDHISGAIEEMNRYDWLSST